MEDKRLETTLALLGIEDIALSKINVIADSGPEARDNAIVYKECNERLRAELEKQKLGQFFHVTGEMRALSDPSHRENCRLAWQYGAPPKMFAYLPKEYRNGTGIWEWNEQHWPLEAQGWQNHLDVFHLLGDREVILYGLFDCEEMHFSLFGDRYVLLQEQHDHNDHVKSVWFLESMEIRSALIPRVEKCITHSKEIPARIFRDFTDSLSDPLHLDLLFCLNDEKSIQLRHLDKRYSSFGISVEKIILDLSLVHFIIIEKDAAHITKPGQEFLKIFSNGSGDDI